MSKIYQLQVENIKRLKAINIKPDGNAVVIGGRNGQGKSSTLDSICMAIGGKDLIPSKPVREGAEKASIRVDLGDYVVTRWWTSPEKSYLKVENKDGAKIESPQKILDQLVGNLSFDPLAFTTLKSQERVSTLKELTKLDFTDLDKEYAAKFSERALVKKEGEQLKGLIEGFSDLEESESVDYDVEALKKELDAINEHNNAVVGLGHKIQSQIEHIERSKQNISKIQQEISELQEKLLKATADLDEYIKLHEKDKADVSKHEKKDPAPIQEKLQKAAVHEANKKRIEQKIKLETQIKEARENYLALDKRLKDINELKLKMVSEAKMPIEGLALGDNEILFNGIPFTQLSSSEQIRISMSIAMALNPKLRVVIIKNGSLLDKDAMEELSQIAQKNDFQVWVETVANTPDGNCIYIEDGEVFGATEEKNDVEL